MTNAATNTCPAERLKSAILLRLPGATVEMGAPITSDGWPVVKASMGAGWWLIACIAKPIVTADRGLLEYLTLRGLRCRHAAVEECAYELRMAGQSELSRRAERRGAPLAPTSPP